MAQEQNQLQQQEMTSEVDTDKLLIEGKKCLAASDPVGAVNCLQEACSLLAATHGQLSKELAEPYYLYGKALLELARVENTVLGSGIPVPDERDSTDDEEDTPGDQTTNGDAPGDQTADGNAPGDQATNGDAPDDQPTNGNAPGNQTVSDAEKTIGENVQATSTAIPDSCDDIAGGTSESAPTNNEPAVGSSTDGAQTEEESDLQIAWQVLELARVICQREDSDESKLKLADINMMLAEVGMESDQYEQAISDLQASLQLREFVLEPQDRRLAEVHFSLGLAYTLSNQVDDAIKSYKKCKEILVQRKEQLEEQVKTAGNNNQKLEDEIKELVGLLPDIDIKVTDAEVLKHVMEERSKELQEGAGDSVTSHGFGTTQSDNGNKVDVNKDAPVTDITHLVRKRPATAISDDDSTKQAKRQRTEEATSNGDNNVNAEQ